MSEAVFTDADIEGLLTAESVLDGAFESLRRIWAVPDAFAKRELSDSEYRTRRLEQELDRLYPRLYTDLIDVMGDHPVATADSGSILVMDALSLREGFQLERDLNEGHDWDVSLS